MICACGRFSKNEVCSSCLHSQSVEEKRQSKEQTKRRVQLEKAKVRNLEPKKGIAKVGTKNLFKCSDGSKVTQEQIHIKLSEAYSKANGGLSCKGCNFSFADGHAHIIAKSRCKVIGKTELIWDTENFFPACNACNLAIENPKGSEWKKLKNLDKCMEFIRLNDSELFQKFLNNGYQAKIKEGETI